MPAMLCVVLSGLTPAGPSSGKGKSMVWCVAASVGETYFLK